MAGRTPDAESSAPKRRMCWKCQKYNVPGAEFCAFCGAQFVTDNDHYQTDGRTISDTDETAYLSAPPPKIKRSYKGIVLMLAIIAVGAVVIVMAAGGTHDVVYNYALTDYEEDGNHVHVEYTLSVKNNKLSDVYVSNFEPVLYIGSSPMPFDDDISYIPFVKGMTWTRTISADVPKSDWAQGVHIGFENRIDTRSFDIAQDTNLAIKKS